MRLTRAIVAAAWGVLLIQAACSGSEPFRDVGGKADDPGSASGMECKLECGDDTACLTECREQKAFGHCELRRAEAARPEYRTFTRHHLRWPCADVDGVDPDAGDGRGQEYCEYYAVIQPPPVTFGGALPLAVDLGRAVGFGTTALELDLDSTQLNQLRNEPAAVVGQCVFTSWHQDVRTPIPACGSPAGCPDIAASPRAKLPSWVNGNRSMGLKLDDEMGRMKSPINSNGAASELWARCVSGATPGDDADPGDPRHDHYIRACMRAFSLYGTEWRRSDPAICAAANRLGDCGCGIDSDGDGEPDIVTPSDIGLAIVPPAALKGAIAAHSGGVRGFELASWDGIGQLPAGCRYVQLGDDSHTVVSCDLTAADVANGVADAKGVCRDLYGDAVVVHAPVPAGDIVCRPTAGAPYANDCGPSPWVLGDEAGDGGGGQCCRMCSVGKACGDACIDENVSCRSEPGCACDDSSVR